MFTLLRGCIAEILLVVRRTFIRLNSEEMKGLGSGRWMQPLW